MELLSQVLADTLGVLETYGLPALVVLMALENLNVPLPSEPLLLYGGYLVWAGEATFPAVVAACLAGTLAGATGSYLIGSRGRWVLDRFGVWVGATPHRIEAADRWFARYGPMAVLYGRVVPLVRTFVSVAAGVARLPFGRFLAYTAIGSTAWICLLVGIGYALGDAWERAEEYLGPAKYVLLAGFLGVVVAAVVVARLRRRDVAELQMPEAPAPGSEVIDLDDMR